MTTRTRKASTPPAEVQADTPPTEADTAAAAAAPEQLAGAGLGRIAYEAYSTAVDGRSVGGEDLPGWDQLVESNPSVAAAWCASSQAVLAATFERR